MPGRLVSVQIAAIFIAVGLGALTVTLLHDPMALIPHPPYGRWVIVRLLVLSSHYLACCSCLAWWTIARIATTPTAYVIAPYSGVRWGSPS